VQKSFRNGRRGFRVRSGLRAKRKSGERARNGGAGCPNPQSHCLTTLIWGGKGGRKNCRGLAAAKPTTSGWGSGTRMGMQGGKERLRHQSGPTEMGLQEKVCRGKSSDRGKKVRKKVLTLMASMPMYRPMQTRREKQPSRSTGNNTNPTPHCMRKLAVTK